MTGTIDDEIKPSSRDHSLDQTLMVTIGAHSGQSIGEFAPGVVIGEAYEVRALIGSGGMGNVYLVRHNILQKEFALKTLNTEEVSETAWRRFQNEAQAIGRMSHPNIVGISNLGLHEGHLPYYVMDLLQGKTLLEILQKRQRLPLEEALPIFIEACAGIEYAHKKGIVHRDIKPGNMVLLDNPDGASHLKIVDFGIAKLSGIKDLASQQLTNAGEIFGSPLYMSPEQCQGGRIDARSDVYSLGCTLFEVLTGRTPFRGQSAIETMLMHQNAKPPSLKSASGGTTFPPMLESIVATMLAKTPMDRYTNMELLAQDLTSALAGQDLPLSPHGTISIVAQAPSNFGGIDQINNNQPFHKTYFKQLVATGLCAGGLVLGATSAWLFGLGHARSDAGDGGMAGSGAKVAAASTSEELARGEDRGKAPEVGELFFRNMADLSGEGNAMSRCPNSAFDTKPYGRDAVKNGKALRIFDFPEDAVIGSWRQLDIEQSQKACMGRRETFPDQKMIYNPTPLALTYPQYLKRFRPGDIYGLTIQAELLNDQGLAACSNLPGVRRLKLDRCSNLTRKSLSSLYKFDCLEELEYTNGPYSVQDIINMPRFKYLKWLHIDAKNLTPLLEAAGRAPHLQELQAINQLSAQDIALISNINSLETLWLNTADLTSVQIQQLAKLPHLRSLGINGCHLSPDACTQFKLFKQLKRLVVDPRSLSDRQKQDLRASLPNIQLEKNPS